MVPLVDEGDRPAGFFKVVLVPIENCRERSGLLFRHVIDSPLRVDESDRQFLELIVEVVGAKSLLVERRTTSARAVKGNVNSRLVELGSNDVFLETIKTHLFAGDLDPRTGEKGEEQILNALGRILGERFMQNPGVV